MLYIRNQFISFANNNNNNNSSSKASNSKAQVIDTLTTSLKNQTPVAVNFKLTVPTFGNTYKLIQVVATAINTVGTKAPTETDDPASNSPSAPSSASSSPTKRKALATD